MNITEGFDVFLFRFQVSPVILERFLHPPLLYGSSQSDASISLPLKCCQQGIDLDLDFASGDENAGVIRPFLVEPASAGRCRRGNRESQSFKSSVFHCRICARHSSGKGIIEVSRIYKFLDGVTADTTGAALTVDTDMYDELVMQIDITTAASVVIEGRIEGITGWGVISDGTITTDKIFRVKTMPEMRAVATGVNGALKVYGVGSIAKVFQ
jgi:hypothetical protein